MEQDYRYEVLVLKHATYLATELMNKINRFESEETTLVPIENVLLSKVFMDRNDFVYRYGKRNLLPALNIALIYEASQENVREALDELSGAVHILITHVVPLECNNMEGEEEERNDIVELYLVKEKCLVQLKKLDDAHLFLVRDNVFSDLIKNVLQMVSCFQTMNKALMEKEKAMRAESYFKLMKETLEKDRMERLKIFKDDSESSSDDGNLAAPPLSPAPEASVEKNGKGNEQEKESTLEDDIENGMDDLNVTSTE